MNINKLALFWTKSSFQTNKKTDSITMYFFLFSSRRRHTRCLSDRSSDVCSSDLCGRALVGEMCDRHRHLERREDRHQLDDVLPGKQELEVPAEGRDTCGELGDLAHPDQIGRASCRDRV